MNTKYSYGTPIGNAGGIYDLSPRTVVSRLLEGTGVHFGCAVEVGTDAGVEVKAVSSSTAAIEGVVVYEAGHEMDKNGKVEFTDGQALSVMTRGKIIVPLSDSATEGLAYGQDVYLVTQYDAKPENVGCFTDNVDTTADKKIQINAKFISKAHDGLAVIELA